MGLAFASLNLDGALLQHHRYADAIPHPEESLQHARAVRTPFPLPSTEARGKNT
jgi:hypothetical protein